MRLARNKCRFVLISGTCVEGALCSICSGGFKCRFVHLVRGALVSAEVQYLEVASVQRSIYRS